MNSAMALELVGYLGSVLVLISMLMTSVVRLRVINLIGSAVFTAYAILIRSYPTAFLNGCLVGVNIYQLLRLRRAAGKSYEIQAVGPGEGFAAWFLERYRDDIARYSPPWIPSRRSAPRALPSSMTIRRPASCWASGRESSSGSCSTTPRPPSATVPWASSCTPLCRTAASNASPARRTAPSMWPTWKRWASIAGRTAPTSRSLPERQG